MRFENEENEVKRLGGERDKEVERKLNDVDADKEERCGRMRRRW